MVIEKHNGDVVITRKAMRPVANPIPGTRHHRRFLQITPVNKKEPVEIAVRDIREIRPGYKASA